MLLLHGFPSDPRSFDAAAALLGRGGLRCYVPYLRGFGPTRFLSDETMRSGQQTRHCRRCPRAARCAGYREGADRRLRLGWPGGMYLCGALAGALHRPARCRWLSHPGSRRSDPARACRDRASDLAPIFHRIRARPARAGRAAAGHLPALAEQWSPGLVDEALFAETAKSFANPDFAEVSWHSYAHRIGAAEGDPRYAALDAALHAAAAGLGADGRADRRRVHLGGGPGANFPSLVAHQVAPGAGHDPAAETPQAFVQALLTLRHAVAHPAN